jgi:phosphatidylglycerophosphate synthase
MERRPIAARSTAWAVRLAEALAQRRITPNAISVVGMLCGIGAGLAFASTRNGDLLPLRWLGGAALVALRLLANMLDGMVAERQGTSSPLGALFNEVPDRISDVATLLGMGYAIHSLPELGWAAALLAVLTAYVRAQVAVVGAPQDFRGPMAKPQRMSLVIAAAILAGLGSAVGIQYLQVAVPQSFLLIIAVGSAWTAWRRLSRGADFLRKGAR